MVYNIITLDGGPNIDAKIPVVDEGDSLEPKSSVKEEEEDPTTFFPSIFSQDFSLLLILLGVRISFSLVSIYSILVRSTVRR